MLKRIFFSAVLFIFFAKLPAQTTNVELHLSLDEKDRIEVKVYPPEVIAKDWTFVVPQIVPGTYMRINYINRYSEFNALDEVGKKLRIKKKNNVLQIKKGENPLAYVSYKVEQSLGNSPVWDEILACAGTVFTDSTFLINFQLITGYFEGYEDLPMEVIIHKNTDIYGAGALKSTLRSANEDRFVVKNYAELIDQPLLYAPVDTASFTIDSNKFHVAVHSEQGNATAEKVMPAFKRIMTAIHGFSGFTSKKDYHFLVYFVDMNRLKGIFKRWGAGSALEHKTSSVYYYNDSPYYDSLYRTFDWIGTHEYFHTIAPLSLHSEKIYDFNFKTPDMSRHLWLYEGVTDYLSALVNQSDATLKNQLHTDVQYAIEYAENRKERSFTESSREIIKANMTNWLSKILQLGNGYSRGKLIAFGLDMEIYERSNGQKRLIDVLLQMKSDYEVKYIPDNELLEVFVDYTHPELHDFFKRYVEGKELVPYKEYIDKLGWKYLEKRTSVHSYARKLDIRYDIDKEQYYVKRTKTNTLGLRKGDYFVTINGALANLTNTQDSLIFSPLLRPKSAEESINIVINRESKELKVTGKANRMKKLKYPRMLKLDDEELTADQKRYRSEFLKIKRSY